MLIQRYAVTIIRKVMLSETLTREFMATSPDHAVYQSLDDEGEHAWIETEPRSAVSTTIFAVPLDPSLAPSHDVPPKPNAQTPKASPPETLTNRQALGFAVQAMFQASELLRTGDKDSAANILAQSCTRWGEHLIANRD